LRDPYPKPASGRDNRRGLEDHPGPRPQWPSRQDERSSAIDTDRFFDARIHVVCGKGGVGKSTVAAALAVVAARSGRAVCVAEVDGKGSLPQLFGANQPSYQPSELSPGVWALTVLPEDALAEYLQVQYHMRHLSRVLTSTHFLDYITTAAPGLKDVLVLGKIWYLEQNRRRDPPGPDFDTIIVDAPASGHMLSFLSAPMGLADAVVTGPVRRQAEWLIDMLRDPRRTRAHLVTLPEEMPVKETLETSAELDGRVRIAQGVVFANAVLAPVFDDAELTTMASRTSELLTRAQEVDLDLDDEDVSSLQKYAHWLAARSDIQRHQLALLEKGLARPIVELPYQFSAGLALPEIEILADAIEDELRDL
jgi:anion-transporting  ArsA/GET3 family ATPase